MAPRPRGALVREPVKAFVPVIPPLPAPYVEHLVAPRGVGDVTLAQAAGEVGSMVGGGGVRVTLAWRESSRGQAELGEVMARTFGSHALVAPASMLTELALGRSEEDAGRLTYLDVLAALLGTPQAPPLPLPVRRAAESVVEAYHRALGVSPSGRPADPMGVGLLVCRCLGVGDRQIRLAIHQGARDPESVGRRSRAGTGCRSCRPDVLTLIDEEVAAVGPRDTPDLSPVERIVWARGGPALRALGVELLSVACAAAGSVVVRVRASRPKPDLYLPPGAAALLRGLLRETVGPDVTVSVAP